MPAGEVGIADAAGPVSDTVFLMPSFVGAFADVARPDGGADGSALTLLTSGVGVPGTCVGGSGFAGGTDRQPRGVVADAEAKVFPTPSFMGAFADVAGPDRGADGSASTLLT